MESLRLIRMETGPTETLGVLKLNDQIFCLILEPPKKENKKSLSCIPTGRYLCKRYKSEKYKTDCLSLYNVPGRSYISIHFGNTAKDTQGCLLVGAYSGILNGERAVLRSRAALKALMIGIRDICYITITEDF